MFKDRQDAGSQLARRLTQFKNRNTVVLGIPRGGMVVAEPIAECLDAPRSVLIVRKIGAPRQEELALGAVGMDEKPLWNTDAVNMLQPDSDWLERKLEEKIQEVRQRKKIFGISKRPSIAGKTVVLVDDGVATGASFEAALQWLKKQEPEKIVAAVACAPADTAERLKNQVDDWVCLVESNDFRAVGQFYRDFRDISDNDVRQILSRRAYLEKTHK